MDFIIELLVELLLDGSFELSKTKKTPKWLRYPLIIIVMLIFIGSAAIILITGYLGLKDIPILGIIILLLGFTYIIVCIKKFKHIYIKRDPNSEEAKARNARMIALTDSTDEKLNDLFESIIRVPQIDELVSPVLAIVPLQLLAYYIAEFLGTDVDQPRNLAKSVTVE